MKQNLLFNQATAISKRLAMVLTMLLIVGIGQAWAQYTKASSIAAGDVVLLVYESGKMELSGISTSNTKYGIGTAYTSTPAGAYELTVEAGSTSGTYSFKCPNGQYLYWTSGNTLATNATKSANTSWKVTFNQGTLTIVNAKDNSRKLQWNASSPRFACYTTNQTAVQLYKKSASYTVNWTINPAAGGSLSPISGTSTTVTPNVAYTYGSPAYTVTPAGKANVSQDGDNFTATPSANCTIQINMVEKTPATISFENMGNPIPTTTGYYVGDTYKLPATNDYTCGDKTFVGWSTVPIDNSTNKPTSNFYEPGAEVTLGANNTFYAVFAEGGGLSDEQEVLLNYTGGTKSDLTNVEGISASGLGSDYAVSNAPYRVKLDNTGDYILYTNNSKPYISQVYFKVKMLGGNTTSKMTIKTSDDGTNYTSKGECSISGDQNNVKDFLVTINTEAKYLQLYFTKGSNVGFGPLIIYTKSSSYQNYTTSCTTPSEYTVTFNANGHGTAPTPQTVASGQKATEPTPAPTATGYTFGGWYKDQICSNDKKFDFDTPITEDITLYAKWTAIQTTITLNANGGSGNTTSVAATYDSSTLNPSSITNPTKTGHTFGGWYSGEGGTGSLVINTSGKLQANVSGYTGANGVWKATTNETLYAKWTPSVYTITYKDQGNATFSGTHESGNPTQHTYGTETTLKGATKTGYTFGGWYKEATCTNKVPSLGATEYTANITLYAQWKANTYTVEFNANGGTGTMDNQSFTYDQSKALSANAFTRTNYAFKNWNTKFDGTGTNYTNQQSVSNLTAENGATVTLYAQWTPTYTITWLANGQEFHKQENAEEGTALDLPNSEPDAATYACDDKVFVGWTASQISGSTDDAPADLFTTKTANVEDAATTYYAVFATADGGGSTTDTYDWESDQTGNWTVDQAIARTQSQGVDVSYAGKINTHNTYVTYNNKVAVTNFAFDFKRASNNENYKVYIETSTDKSTWTAVATYPMTDFGNGSYTSKSHTFDGTQELYVRFHCYNTTAIRYVDNVSITYGGTSYSEYVTTCAVIPDPVWAGAVIDNATIAVNCGETSPMNSASTISFPAATNNTLTYDITVTASNGFLVSTNKIDNTKYGESVTVSPVKTGTNAGTITQKVYVRAVAPAMSSDDFTGTITISGKQIETQTINVTADVTCTDYTLTLVDRGVSTEQPGTYFAGQTIDEAPADPTGVCTDPIHYVFDGWAAETVVTDATTYTPVSFPYTVTGNTKFYAVYRYTGDGGEPSNDFIKVTSAKDDWTGDYVIVNEDAEKAIGNAYQNTNTLKAHDVTISDNKVVSPSNDIIWQIRKNGEYYTMYNTAAEKYAYVEKADAKGAGLSTTAQNMQIIFNDGSAKVSGVDIYRCFYYYGTNTEWRTYATGSYNTGALYCRSLETYLYTTSPICGPHMEITAGEDIYVTGGYKNGTRDLVIAQQQVEFKATRLNTSNGKSDGTAPDVKVASNGITVGGQTTTDVKVVIEQNKEQQLDGTYTITGTITVQYQPSAANKQEDVNVQLVVDYPTYNADATANFTVHARSLPKEFVIVAKQGDKWYALNGDMNNGSSANPANGQVTLDNDANPTKATYAPCNTIYTFDGLPNTGDRTRVRFQGTDGAWLWAASGTNVGIQNKSLKDTPEGENKAYNWKLETDDNITYKFHNDNNSRLLGLSGEKFGMYASAVQELRILPYEEKCLYNYAPSNLKVSVLKGTYVTLTWDAVAGATKYQYSTDATNWTDAGSEPTVTINGLTSETNYTYYIRAYHADAGVNQECFDYSEVTFNTANCDDVPTDISYTADLNSITVSWTASAPTATIKLSMNADGTGGGGIYNGATSPYKISGGLTKNTTYYIQILADGTCASPIIPVKTEDIKVDVVEWQPQGIVVDINTNETVGVTLENEVSYGSGTGVEATELFFSKYYEATGNVKLVAIYNGTKNIIDLTDYEIHYGKDSWESQHITLKDFGETKGQIQPGEELILYTTNESDDDNKILDCVNKEYPDGKWVRVTQTNNDGKGHLSFAGNKTLVLKKDGVVIDVIGALTSAGNPTSTKAKDTPSWGDAAGWNCATGLSIADDTQIGISTNRCLLIRNNTVTSGANAVTSNIDDFVTLCSEWKGAQVPDNNVDNGVAASCENFAYVGTFDYSDYYTQFETMGEEQTFDENARNEDGTVTVEIPDLYKQSCRNIRITLEDKDGNVLSNREYKVPIMITTTQGTDGQAFIDLRHNLATKIDDGNGGLIDQDLTYEEVLEICKTCDVVIRDNATLQKMADDAENDHPQVRDIYVYENSSLIVPNGTNYTINNLSLRRKEDAVASVSAYPEALILPESAAAPISLDFRLSAKSWHWFTLPYDCKISEVTWVDGSPAQYNVDWFLMTYDGEKRAETQAGGCWKEYTGTTINAGDGFILAINGNINNPAHTYELRFPMSKDVLVAEGTDKTVDVRAWGVETNIRPNHKGWNLVGNPYLAYYQRNNITNFEGLRLGQLTGPDSQTGYWEQTGEVPYVVVPIGAGWEAYEQLLASETDLLPFTAYFVQVGNDGKHDSSDELSISFDHTKLQLSATPMPASIIQRATSETEVTEPVIVGVSLTNSLGESDKTSLVIDNQFTDEYEMNADFFKWFGDYYKYYTKPVVYSLGADNGKRAFNALSEDLATQPISLGMYAAQAGNYTFTLDRRSDLSKVQEVWLYDATEDKYTNLMQDNYTFNTAKTESAGRFFLSVKMAPKVSTDINNVTDGTIWATTQDHTIFVNGLLSNAQLWIYDATGKLLHTDQTQYYQHTYQVPVSGTYFVRVQNTMQTQTIKVVVE